MTPTKFRSIYSHLGVTCELLIGNVIVGNFTWHIAEQLAIALLVVHGRKS